MLCKFCAAAVAVVALVLVLVGGEESTYKEKITGK
jgi:hypothetical protein